MANLSVKNRSGESYLNSAYFRRYFAAGYVDPTITTGIPIGTLVYLDSSDGYVKVADQNTDIPAMGICYGSTNKDIRDAWTDNPRTNWLPQAYGGDRMEMEKIASVRIVEDTVSFRMRDETLTGTVAIAGDTSLTGTGTLFTTELQIGDYILVDSEIRQVDTITSATAATVSVAFTNTKTGQAIVGKGMKNKPVFTGENGTSTKFGKLGIENITVLVPITGDGLSQQIGWIEDSKAIQIDLSQDLSGTVI